MIEVLFISNNLGRGGKERQIHEMLNYFSASDIPVRITLLLREPIVSYDLNGMKNITLCIPSKRLSGIEFIIFCYHQCRKKTPQIVHTWESGCAFLFCLLKIFIFRDIKILDGTLRYSKVFSEYSKKYWVARIARMISNKVVANSNAGLLSIGYLKGHKYAVIGNGINLERFPPIKSINFNGVLTIGMLASFSKPKDFKTLIDAALIRLKEGKECRVILVGDGPEKNIVMNYIPDEFKSYFEFTGKLEHPENYVKLFDISVLLSKKGHSEGMSNSIMEYMAMGKPVICSNTGGNGELVINNINGYLIQREDLKELNEKIELLASDFNLIKKMGAASRAIIEKDYDIAQVCNKYYTVYKSLI
jgi:glycosyltransferase involved in cell wall biosynthesis